MAASPWPRWIDRRSEFNLREVRPGLFVGAAKAPSRRVVPFRSIVDFYGSSGQPLRASWYAPSVLLRFPFDDGRPFPEGALDAVYGVVEGGLLRGPVLLHCAAGLSRSASAAYAMLRRLDGLSHVEALRRVSTVDTRFPMETTLQSARAWVHGD